MLAGNEKGFTRETPARIAVMEQVRTPDFHCWLQIPPHTESRGKYCQDYPPVTLSKLRISLITEEFKDPVNLILFALPPVWHWCSCEPIGCKRGSPNCICIIRGIKFINGMIFLVSANLNRSPGTDLACVAEPLQKKIQIKALFSASLPIPHYTLHKLKK